MQSQIERQKKRGIQRTQRKLKKKLELSSLYQPTAQQIQSKKAYRAKKREFSNTLYIEDLRQYYELHKQIPEDLDRTFVVVYKDRNHHTKGRRTQGSQLTKNFMSNAYSTLKPEVKRTWVIMRALHKSNQSWLLTEDYHGWFCRFASSIGVGMSSLPTNNSLEGTNNILHVEEFKLLRRLYIMHLSRGNQR